jgi:hypothetical protein
MKTLKILVLSLILILGFTVSANAVSINKIVSKPVLSKELKVLSYLIFTKHKNFSMHDLRELLRNYRGGRSIDLLISEMINKKLAKKLIKNPKCIDYQFVLKNNKIVKEKTDMICNFLLGEYLSRSHIYHQKVLGNFVQKLLILNNNIYNNINSQGRHLETALYIAAVRREIMVVKALLTDKNVNPRITSISEFKGARTPYQNFRDYIITENGSAFSNPMTREFKKVDNELLKKTNK